MAMGVRKESNLAPIEFPIKLCILFFYEFLQFTFDSSASFKAEEGSGQKILNSILMEKSSVTPVLRSPGEVI